jgi:hypothetical protein
MQPNARANAVSKFYGARRMREETQGGPRLLPVNWPLGFRIPKCIRGINASVQLDHIEPAKLCLSFRTILAVGTKRHGPVVKVRRVYPGILVPEFFGDFHQNFITLLITRC